jgi:hypothetical protein
MEHRKAPSGNTRAPRKRRLAVSPRLRRILSEAAKRAEADGARKIHTVRYPGNCAKQLAAAAHEIADRASLSAAAAPAGLKT